MRRSLCNVNFKSIKLTKIDEIHFTSSTLSLFDFINIYLMS